MEILDIKESVRHSMFVEITTQTKAKDDKDKLDEVNLLEELENILTNKWQYNVYYKESVEALENCIKSSKYHELTPLYYQLANLCYHMGNYTQTNYFCKKSREYVTICNSEKKEALIKGIRLIDLLSFMKEHKYDELFQEIANVKKEIQEEDFLHRVTIIEAKAYMALKEYDTAQKVFDILLNKSIKIDIQKEVYLKSSICCKYLGKIEKSNDLFYKACHMIDLHLKDPDVNLLLERAERNYDEENYGLVLEDLTVAKEFLEKHNINEGRIRVYSLMGELYATLGNLIESRKYFSKIMSIAEYGERSW